jgi:hypothetical protein
MLLKFELNLITYKILQPNSLTFPTIEFGGWSYSKNLIIGDSLNFERDSNITLKF